MPTYGSRLLRLAPVAALALALAFAGDAGAERPKLISQPSIGANPVVGQPLGVNMGSFFCSPECFEFTVEFMRCAPGSTTVGCVSVRAASANAFYTPTEDDIGFSLHGIVRAWNYDCDITMTDCRNSALEVPTAATAPVKEDAPPVAVTIATSELRDAEAGIPYSQSLRVSSGKPPITWALAGGSLPPGLSLSSAGLISGTPRTAGKYSFTVRATGARRQTDTKQLTLEVKLQLSPRGGTILRAAVATAYRQTFSVVAGGTPPYTWVLAGGVLPEGLTFRDGVISGTPARASKSTFMLEIEDARGASASTIWTLEVRAATLVVTPSALPNATSGMPYRQVLTASGGKPPYRFRVLSDCALPPGLTLSATGVLAGRPSAAAGLYAFDVVVEDANGAPGPVAEPGPSGEPYAMRYVLKLSAGRRPAATALVAAVVGKRYRWEFGACGGRLPFQYEVVAGRLPAGMQLGAGTGLLSGTPATSGTFRFTLRMSDTYGLLRERTYTLAVHPRRRR